MAEDRKTLKTIALVVVYLGKLPKWINLFIQSCESNPDVNWFIFNDRSLPKHHGANVKFIKMDLKGFNALASEKLGLNVRIKETYKLCDFKPCYGVIFEEYLKGYDFWGHIDLDMIFGNIRKFITDDILENYDIISGDHRRTCGCFNIFRNCKKINYLYKGSNQYKEILEKSSGFCHFDEEGIGKFKPSIDTIIKEAEKAGILKCLFKDFQVYENTVPSYWKEGRLIVKSTNSEVMFTHFMPFKRRIGFRFFKYRKMEDGFVITKSDFQPLINGGKK